MSTLSSRRCDIGRPRILHLLPDLEIGGGQTIVLNHVRHSDRARYDVQVAQLDGPTTMLPAFVEAGATPFAVGRGGATTVTRLVREIRRRKIDLLHVHSDVDRKWGQVASLLTRTPVVGHLHAEWVHLGPHLPAGAGVARRAKSITASAARDAIERRTARAYIAESRDVARIFEPLVRQPIDVLAQSIPHEQYSDPDRLGRADWLAAELGVRDRQVLVSVSRLVEGKGQHHLLDALAQLILDRPELTLLLVGDGPLREDLEKRAARLGLTANVRFLGNRHDVPDILALGDVFVFGSESEGFGLAVLEAMAAGLPVVAFDLPAFHEFVVDGTTGHLVPVGDVSTLAGRTAELLTEPATATVMGRRGREIAQQQFPSDAVARTFERVYDSVLDRRGHDHTEKP